jgi:hypothetical protein
MMNQLEENASGTHATADTKPAIAMADLLRRLCSIINIAKFTQRIVFAMMQAGHYSCARDVNGNELSLHQSNPAKHSV